MASAPLVLLLALCVQSVTFSPLSPLCTSTPSQVLNGAWHSNFTSCDRDGYNAAPWESQCDASGILELLFSGSFRIDLLQTKPTAGCNDYASLNSNSLVLEYYSPFLDGDLAAMAHARFNWTVNMPNCTVASCDLYFFFYNSTNLPLTVINFQGAYSQLGCYCRDGNIGAPFGALGVQIGQLMSLLGRPVVTGTVNSTLSGHGDLYFFSLSDHRDPTSSPTSSPTPIPTGKPSTSPTTSRPSTAVPTTQLPTSTPSSSPTTQAPTTSHPSPAPTSNPTTYSPSFTPSGLPTPTPSAAPSSVPTTFNPTTVVPTTSAPTTAQPTSDPTALPSAGPSAVPSSLPTAVPSTEPSDAPTAAPTSFPTAVPTRAPTRAPTSPAAGAAEAVATPYVIAPLTAIVVVVALVFSYVIYRRRRMSAKPSAPPQPPPEDQIEGASSEQELAAYASTQQA